MKQIKSHIKTVFILCSLFFVLIGNAHLMYTNITDLYRLAITELRNGVFFVDFRWKKGMRSVEIINI